MKNWIILIGSVLLATAVNAQATAPETSPDVQIARAPENPAPTVNSPIDVPETSRRPLRKPASTKKTAVKESRKTREPAAEVNSDYPRFTYDLGGSFGKFGTKSYFELNLGLNTYFEEYFAWRNAVFYRSISEAEDYFGLDTSARGILSVGGSALGVTMFAGPGWRFASRGKNNPFLEAGAVIKLAGLNLGGGVKTFLNKWSDRNASNDTQFFLILSGAGEL